MPQNKELQKQKHDKTPTLVSHKTKPIVIQTM
jgi:hypothetical protein